MQTEARIECLEIRLIWISPTGTWRSVLYASVCNITKLEREPMPNVMAAQSNIGGALCESSVIQFLVPRHKVWLTATVRVLCINAANIGERKTSVQ